MRTTKVAALGALFCLGGMSACSFKQSEMTSAAPEAPLVETAIGESDIAPVELPPAEEAEPDQDTTAGLATAEPPSEPVPPAEFTNPSATPTPTGVSPTPAPSGEVAPTPSPPPSPVPSASPTAAPEPEPVFQAKLSWTGGEAIQRVLTKSEARRTFKMNAPVTLSASVPNQIEIELTLPPYPVREELIYTDVTAGFGEGDDRHQIRATPFVADYGTNGGTSRIQLKLDGLRTLLPDHDEVKLYVQSHFRSALTGNHFASVYFVLETPPTKIGIERFQVDEFEQIAHSPISSDIKEISTASDPWSLTQVIRLTNRSDQPIEIGYFQELLPRITKYQTFFKTERDPTDIEKCRHRSVESPTLNTTLIGGSGVLVPLQSDLARNWSLIRSQWSGEAILTPGESTLIGLYFPSFRQDSLFSENLRRELDAAKVIQYTDIPTRCEYGCQPDFQNFYTSGQGRSQCLLIPQADTEKRILCEKRFNTCFSCIEKWFFSPHGTVSWKDVLWGSSCDQCHRLEVDPEFSWAKEDKFAFCDEWSARVAETQRVPAGWVSRGVFLEFDSGVEQAFVRFAHSSWEDDPEVRVISLFPERTPLK